LLRLLLLVLLLLQRAYVCAGSAEDCNACTLRRQPRGETAAATAAAFDLGVMFAWQHVCCLLTT
jgi:hypothetical protein